MKYYISVLAIFACLPWSGVMRAARGGPAADPPSFAFPHDMATYRITAAFDLDPATGAQADWTGWRSDDTGTGSGHAYDGHNGTDTGLPNGTALYAIAPGTVTSLRESVPDDAHSDTGNYLIMRHTIGSAVYESRFWHLQQNGVLPALNGSILKGQHVAYSNNTGNSTGPHLHYAILRTSASGGSGYNTCPYYHGWWEQDEFYYGNGRVCSVYVAIDPSVATLNCRAGSSTSYAAITSLAGGRRFAAIERNTWWRIFLPMPPARAIESRLPSGALNAAAYSESGAWNDDAARSAASDASDDPNRVALTGAGSRYSAFSGSGGADSATFTFRPTQRGNYRIFATWPAAANAAGATARIQHDDGAGAITSDDVVFDQAGLYDAPGGSGTQASPYLIDRNPYLAYHTTVGGQDLWNLYNCSTAPEEGPERIYKIVVYAPTSITVSVEHADYPTKDVDIHLLSALSASSCLARADFSFTYSLPAAGTYYIAADTYGSGAAAEARATDYTLTVTLDDTAALPNSWVRLGEYFYLPGVDYTVQFLENTVTGPVNAGAPGRFYAGAIKVAPVLTYRSGWHSDNALYSARIDTSATPVCSVVVHEDSTGLNDSRVIDEYKEIPIYQSPGADSTNSSPVVAKAVTGQRFVCTARTLDGWYRVDLTNACDAPEGWISGDHLILYNAAAAPVYSGVNEWRFY